MNLQLEKIKLTELQKGDIFQWQSGLSEMKRFHSIHIRDEGFDVLLARWGYAGPIEKLLAHGSTLRNTDVDVYLIKFPISDYKKSFGKPYYPGCGNQRVFFAFELNERNILKT